MKKWKAYGAWIAWTVMIICYPLGSIHIGLASIDLKGADWDPAVTRFLRSTFGRQQENFFWGIALIALAIIAQIIERFLKPLPEDNLAFDPRGRGVQKGTLEDFLQEITHSANEIVREAKDYFEVALNELSTGDFKAAARDFSRSVTIAPTMSAYLNLGASLYFCSEWLEAKNSFGSGLEIARRLKDELFEARFINNLGLLELHMGNLAEARRHFERAGRLFKQYGNMEGAAATLGNLGDIAYLIGHYGEAHDLQMKATKAFRKINHRIGEAYAQIGLGTVLAAQGRLFETLSCYDAAYKIFKASNNPIGVAHALGNQASTWAQTGDFSKALELHYEALKLGRENGDRVGEAFNLQNIGSVKFRMGQIGEALENYNAALKINREVKNRSGEAECLGNMSNIYMGPGKLRDLKEAEELLRKTHEIYVGMDYTDAAATVKISLGNLYYMKGELEESRQVLREALAHQKKVGNLDGQASALVNLGLVDAAEGRFDAALTQYNQALKIQETIKDNLGKAIVLGNIGNVFARKGDRDAALKYLRSAQTLYSQMGVEDEGVRTVNQLIAELTGAVD
jgi:tetratricopeptide (TPR) repeat protein